MKTGETGQPNQVWNDRSEPSLSSSCAFQAWIGQFASSAREGSEKMYVDPIKFQPQPKNLEEFNEVFLRC